MQVDFTQPIQNCFLCRTPLDRELLPLLESFQYLCKVCGVVWIDRDVVRKFRSRLNNKVYLFSGFCRERTELDLKPIKIDEGNYEDILKSSNLPKDITQKLDCILLHLERESEFAGKSVELIPELSFPIAFAKNPDEFRFFLRQLDFKNWIAIDPDRKQVTLTLDGWNRVDEIHRFRGPNKQVFIAMWFTDETKRAYNDGLYKAIDECGFIPIRIDLIQHNERIDDRIIAEIRKSAFLVADFTGHRGGVFFETGFAMGLGIPVIWTCRKDYIETAHFDTRQYNHIVWENETELYQKLKDRIEATIIK